MRDFLFRECGPQTLGQGVSVYNQHLAITVRCLMLYWDEPLTPTLGEGHRPCTPGPPLTMQQGRAHPPTGPIQMSRLRSPSLSFQGSMVSLETGGDQNDT